MPNVKPTASECIEKFKANFTQLIVKAEITISDEAKIELEQIIANTLLENYYPTTFDSVINDIKYLSPITWSAKGNKAVLISPEASKTLLDIPINKINLLDDLVHETIFGTCNKEYLRELSAIPSFLPSFNTSSYEVNLTTETSEEARQRAHGYREFKLTCTIS